MIRASKNHEGDPCKRCGRLRIGDEYIPHRLICRTCNRTDNRLRGQRLKRQAKAGMCVLCRVNKAIDDELATCQACIDFSDSRLSLAAAEKAQTQGEILRDGLLGDDDIRPGMARKRQMARANVKIGGPMETSKVIWGRPRTGRYH